MAPQALRLAKLALLVQQETVAAPHVSQEHTRLVRARQCAKSAHLILAQVLELVRVIGQSRVGCPQAVPPRNQVYQLGSLPENQHLSHQARLRHPHLNPRRSQLLPQQAHPVLCLLTLPIG